MKGFGKQIYKQMVDRAFKNTRSMTNAGDLKQ